MSVLVANCPACGASVEFKSGQSIVVICSYCRSAVARTDRDLKDLGKVAEIVETGSPLDIGIQGRWKDIPFELTGRAQLGHEMGGQWDEWYATFSNGWLGWLAEAQGRFYLTFQHPIPENVNLPSFEQLQLGQSIGGLPWPTSLIVAETGRATALGAKGEIPYLLTPGDTYYYADLSGPNQGFGTLDYNETPPLVFLGQQVTLTEIGITSTRAPEREQKEVAAAQLACPQCGGTLDLRAPDKTERVTCPSCNSLLDVNQGQLKFLKALGKPSFQPVIPIGTTGDVPEGKMTVIGAMTRSVTIEGTQYFWGEYLLYNPQIGFRWLVNSDDYWNYVEAIPPGEISELADSVSLTTPLGAQDRPAKSVDFRGRNYRIFQDAPAVVESVLGEFYWKVEAGENVRATDYVSPPYMLSKEVTTLLVPQPTRPGKKQNIGEINWSLGTYVTPAQIEKSFGVSDLPRPSIIAPNQPYLYKWIYKYWIIFILAGLLVACLSFITSGSTKEVFSQRVTFEPLPNEDGTQVFFSEPFQLSGHRNIRITGESPVQNTWVYLEGDLISDDTGLVQSFPVDISYYQGVEDGEAWTEGAQKNSTDTSSLPAGKYVLRLEAQWERWQQPASVSVRIEQNVSNGFNFVLMLIGLSIVPVIMAIYHFTFEKRRWSESMFTPISDSGDDDD